MNLVEQLRQLRSSSQVSLHEFLTSLNYNDSCIHIFYEGKTDNSFYGTIVRQHISDNILLKTYKCGNKNEVYKTKQRLTQRNYKNNKLLFFADKDLDDIIPVHREESEIIHITEFYSIENYIVTKEIFSAICSDIFHIDIGTQFMLLLEQKFCNANSKFCKWSIKLMSWIIYCRRMDVDVNLKDINMNRLCGVSEELNFSIKLDDADLYEHLSQTAKLNIEINPEEITSITNEISEINPYYYVRGKFHCWFLCEFLNITKNVIEEAEKRKIKCHININMSTILDIASPRLLPPSSITNFLHKHQIEFSG